MDTYNLCLSFVDVGFNLDYYPSFEFVYNGQR